MVPGAAGSRVSILPGDTASGPSVTFLYLAPAQFLLGPSCLIPQLCSCFPAAGSTLKLLVKTTVMETLWIPLHPPRGILIHLPLLPCPTLAVAPELTLNIQSTCLEVSLLWYLCSARCVYLQGIKRIWKKTHTVSYPSLKVFFHVRCQVFKGADVCLGRCTQSCGDFYPPRPSLPWACPLPTRACAHKAHMLLPMSMSPHLSLLR